MKNSNLIWIYAYFIDFFFFLEKRGGQQTCLDALIFCNGTLIFCDDTLIFFLNSEHLTLDSFITLKSCCEGIFVLPCFQRFFCCCCVEQNKT